MKNLRILLLSTLLLCIVSLNGASKPPHNTHRTSRKLLANGGDTTDHIFTDAQKFMPAALAEDSAGSAHALTIRRALKYDPFEAAADAFKSLATAEADAAASAAGRAAGKEAENVMDALFPPLGTMPFPVTTPAADTPVAAPLQAASEKAAVIPAPPHAPTPAPSAAPAIAPASSYLAAARAPAPSAALATAPAVSDLAAASANGSASAAAAPSASQEEDPLQERTQDVPNFQLGAFLLHHANAIVPLAEGNGSHIIQATKLAQQQLQAETIYWMDQQHTRRKLQETPSAVNISELLEDIPQSFADLPGEVAENVAGFTQHLGSQGMNATYYMQQFDELRHKLQDPVALQAGAQLFANNLCLFSTNLGALEASATGISVAPSLLSLSAAGVNVAPQGISISPALLSVGATGVNVAPQGLNIAPALIAVTPGRVAVNPQGGTISPVGLSVTAPAGDSKPSKPGQGRRSLRHTMFEDLAHTVDTLAAGAQAAATEFLGATPASAVSPPAAPPAASPAQPLTAQTAAGTAGANFTLPVALKGLHNWAAVVGTMCNAANMDSTACLHEYFSHTSSMLNTLAERYSSLKGGDILAALGHDFPKLEIKRPTFFSSSNDVASSNVGAVQLSATGVSVSPCAIPIGPVGASISATGINVGPTLISLSATGVNVQPQGLNVSPNLIVVGPYDTTVAGQGLNIAPALITVSPTKTVVNPVGPLKVADAKVTETLPALPEPGNNA